MKKSVSMLGDGAWGTAMATVLANNECRVKLWCRTPEVAHSIKNTKINSRYLPEIVLNDLIDPILDLQEVLHETEWIFIAIPVQFTRAVMQQIVPFVKKDQKFVILSKGIEQNTLMFPSQIIDDVLGYEAAQAVCCGPTFAQELATQKISAVNIAATTVACSNELQVLLNNNYFNSYISTDMLGIQICSALKNVVAVALGMLDGDYAQNTKAFMLTRGLQDIATLSVALGGKRETVYGLCGVGDLVLTATSSMSKNMHLGQRLGKGENLDAIVEEAGILPEGINTIKSVYQLMQKRDIDLPVFKGLYEVIFQNMPITTFIYCLFVE